MPGTASVWDPEHPWGSIAHAIEHWDGLPEIVGVPEEPPAESFTVGAVTVIVRQAEGILGVACWGHQAIDPDIKAVWLSKARRGL